MSKVIDVTDYKSVDDKPPSWLKRVFMLFLPKRLHKYLTPEVFVAWNVSSFVTMGQFFLASNWKFISTWAVNVAKPAIVAGAKWVAAVTSAAYHTLMQSA